MATPRYFTGLRPNGKAQVRYWMLDNSSIHVGDFPTLADADTEAERLNKESAERAARHEEAFAVFAAEYRAG